MYSLSILAAGVIGPSIPGAGLARSHAPTIAQFETLIAADRKLSGPFDLADGSSTITSLLTEDVALFAIPVPGLARNKADARQVLGKAFGPGQSVVTTVPIRVGLSSDGTQGFSFGFMNVGRDKLKLGKYVAYWVRSAAGWQVAAFKWVPRPEGTVSTGRREPALPTKFAASAKDNFAHEQYRKSLDATERRFSADAQTMGIGRAFRKYGSADAMNVGGEADFTFGNDAIAEAQGGDAAKGSPVRWAPDGVLVSSSGDLGVTFGYLDRNGATPPGRLTRIPFFTIWRRAAPKDEWRYVAE
ncbi:hypothetical protein H9L14_11220 [Sphingomonas sediminicola]|uniref:Nuclear transport factor 2 family protein n=1 Tax=Sphingomonas sediminicola TaxID=386874 RepID=A0ABX6T873_9SPHN|nr:hypothetical protein [Sphingomonas sediminicola]QNP45210.1 hypothetical protein H9L14_11220 [Sphingomonas sediminicola]